MRDDNRHGGCLEHSARNASPESAPARSDDQQPRPAPCCDFDELIDRLPSTISPCAMTPHRVATDKAASSALCPRKSARTDRRCERTLPPIAGGRGRTWMKVSGAFSSSASCAATSAVARAVVDSTAATTGALTVVVAIARPRDARGPAPRRFSVSGGVSVLVIGQLLSTVAASSMGHTEVRPTPS